MALADEVASLGIAVNQEMETAREMRFYEITRGVSHAYKIRSGEGGDYRHGHDNRIDFRFEDSERHTERGDDEGELTYLR